MSAPATILRKRHRLRAFSSEVNSWARFTGSVDTLSLTPEELATKFEDLCGEEVGSLEAFLQLAGREATVENRRLACHLAIILANEIGQPKGQELRQENPGTSRTDQQEGAAAKRPRTDQPEDRPDNDVVARLGKLESAMKASTESTEGAKARVRALALHTQPNEALILLQLDHLARMSRKQRHPEAEMYDELARQAAQYQGKVEISNLVLTVLGGKASDAISKALTRCLKDRKTDEQKPAKEGVFGFASPLQNVYPGPSQHMFSPYGSPPGMFHFQSQNYFPRRYGRSYGSGYGSGNNGPRGFKQRGACHFCESTSHLIKDCEAMKLAKKK